MPCCANSVSPADILEWSEMKQFRKMMESTRKLTIADYIDEESLFALLRPTPGGLAPCKLLDGEWLLRRAETLSQCTDPEQRKSLALPRRQDLERQHGHDRERARRPAHRGCAHPQLQGRADDDVHRAAGLRLCDEKIWVGSTCISDGAAM